MAFLCAGLMVAVQIINPNQNSVEEFEQLSNNDSSTQPYSAANGSDLAPASAVEAAPIDDLTDRLANMVSDELIEAADHPLEPVLVMAQEGLKRMAQSTRDYTATIVSQVTEGETIHPERRIFCKIRHAQTVAQGTALAGREKPFSIYLKMLQPDSIAGQEAIWVDGQNNNKLIAHATGLLNIKRVYLDPTGTMAMQGNLHPIYDIGFLNLIEKMVEAGQRDLKHADCSVALTRDVEVGGRTCTVIEIKHAKRAEHFDFHIAKIYIDQQQDTLIGYEGFLWPKKEGDPPVLKEKYFYTNLKLNVGFTDEDFSPDNKAYNYPSW